MNRKLVEYNSVPVGMRYAFGLDHEWRVKADARPLNFLVYVPRTIAFVGHGRHGKDECCRLWSEITGGTNAGTLSQYLIQVIPAYLDTLETLPAPREELCDFEQRHAYRSVWRAAGDWARRDDPTALITLALAKGEITGGIRGKPEVQGGRSLLDLIVWVERPGYPEDPTMEYGREEADVIILNDRGLEDLHRKLKRIWEAFQ